MSSSVGFFQKLSFYLGLWALATAPLYLNAAETSEPNTAPVVKIRWQNDKSQDTRLNWNYVSGWGWSEITPEVPIQLPYLRTWIQIPPNLTLVDVDSEFLVTADPTDSPLKGQIIAIDMNAPSGKATLTFENPSGKRYVIQALVQAKLTSPFLVLHSSCTNQKISIRETKGGGKHFYVGAVCQTVGANTLDLYVIRSANAEIKGTSFKDSKVAGDNWNLYFIKLKDDSKRDLATLGRFRVSKSQEPIFSEYSITSATGVAASKRLNMSAGLGPTFLKYTENPRQIRLTELGITGKFNISYVLVPNLLDIGGNVFGTLFAVTHTPSSLGTVRFYGFNGRLGFLLPYQIGGISFQLSTGWYLWNMHVQEDQFGVTLLSGPQLFFTTRYAAEKQRSFWIYTKFAPIAESPASFSLSNREVAAGGGYQVSSPGTLPWFVTLDVAHAAFASAVDGNEMRLFSFSVGTSLSF